MADFSFSDDDRIHLLKAQVDEDPDSYERWEALVNAAQNQEGGLHRNSSPEALTACRQTYDAFLARFPLFFGYWTRYADFDFSIAGSEAAELVYERGVASCPHAVDLWAKFCAFKMDTCHNHEVTRELFERGAETVGLDYNAHTFWDKYVEFESQQGAQRGFELLSRVVKIPQVQYARFWEQYRQIATRLPVNSLVDAETLYNCQLEASQELGQGVGNPRIYEQTLRKKIDIHLTKDYASVERAVNERWPFEQKITQTYYMASKLDDAQLQNWQEYLTYEESIDSSEGDQASYERTKLLYERCLIPAANNDELWFRYIRWLMAFGDRTEEIRSAYQRASFVFVDIAKPAIRLAWAKFEESKGRPDVSIDIHEAILMQLPNDFETYESLMHVIRRNSGHGVAEEKIKALLADQNISTETRGAILAEWARFKWQSEGDYSASLALFPQFHAQLSSAHTFWSGWLVFESERPKLDGDDTDIYRQVRRVHILAQTSTDLNIGALRALAAQYMAYLDARGPADSTTESVLLDAYINGPARNSKSKGFESLFTDHMTNGSQV